MIPVRKFDWKLVGIGIGAVLLLWLIAGVILAGREPPPPPPGSEPITFMGGKVVGNRISTRSWTFDYQKAQMSADQVNASVEGVHNGVLYKNGKPYLKLSAKHVSVNTQTFDFTAAGAVHIDSISAKDGTTRSFDTDLVQWTNATKMLLLPHPCLIRTGDQILKVANISVDFNTNDVHLGKIEGALEAPVP